jgi:RND family efflux transporter MFP subunit
MYVYFFVDELTLLRYKKQALDQALKDKEQGKTPPDGATESDMIVEMGLANDAGYPRKGVMDFIDNRVDPGTGTIKVRARFSNPKQADGRRLLTPGLFARVRVAVSDRHKAILVSERALLSDQNLKYVLVVNRADKNVVERVDVQPGAVQEDGLCIINYGLKGDEWVIVEGLTLVRIGQSVQPREVPMPRRPGSNQTAPVKSKD